MSHINRKTTIVGINGSGGGGGGTPQPIEFPVKSVNTKTGDVVLTPEDIGINFNQPNNPVTLNEQGKVPAEYLPTPSGGGGGEAEPFVVGAWDVVDRRPIPEPEIIDPTVSEYLTVSEISPDQSVSVVFNRKKSSDSPVVLDSASTLPSSYVNGKITLPSSIAESSLLYKLKDIDPKKMIDLVVQSADFTDKIREIEIVFTQSNDLAVVNGNGDTIERMIIKADPEDSGRIVLGSKFYQSTNTLLTEGSVVTFGLTNDKRVLRTRRTDDVSLDSVDFLSSENYNPAEKFNVYIYVHGIDNGDGTYFAGGEIELGKELNPYEVPLIEYPNGTVYNGTVIREQFGNKAFYYMLYNRAEKELYDQGLADSYDNIKIGYDPSSTNLQVFENDEIASVISNKEIGVTVMIVATEGIIVDQGYVTLYEYEPNKYNSVALYFNNRGAYALPDGSQWSNLTYYPTYAYYPYVPFVPELPEGVADGKVYKVEGVAEYGGKKIKTGDYVKFYGDTEEIIVSRLPIDEVVNINSFAIFSDNGRTQYFNPTSSGFLNINGRIGDTLKLIVNIPEGVNIQMFVSYDDFVFGSSELQSGKCSIITISWIDELIRIVEIQTSN